MKTIDSIVLSQFILATAGKMDHLKLQKLIYYCQAWHLALFDKPLIDDEFQAWLHGPVSRKVWEKYRLRSILWNDIETTEEELRGVVENTNKELDENQLELLADVLREYGPKSSLHLEKLTHSESPWIEARRDVGPAESCENVISKESIRAYFKKLLIP